MAARDLLGRLGGKVPGALQRIDATNGTSNAEAPELAPLGGTREEALQRLQIGLSGLATMILLIGVASIIGGQAEKAEEAAVPDAAPTTEPTAAPPQRDPLADAGVVPDIPAEPEATPSPTPSAPQPQETGADGTVTVPDTPPLEPTDRNDAPN